MRNMNVSSQSKVFFPLVSLMTLLTVSAQAQQPRHELASGPGQGGRPAAQIHAGRPPAGSPPGRAADVRFARGAVVTRDFDGHPYRGRVAWEGGRWRHEMHNGRMGWWWDVGGVWYYYPEPIEGPPTYISDDYADDVVYAAAPPPDYVPPTAAYAPPPPPPPAADPGASALGGAIVGGVLGGLLTGHASGAAAGAVIGGATGAIAGATAASRPGYYLAQGNCYYRYPSGQYVLADPRWCY
jgi:hypothetical protein